MLKPTNLWFVKAKRAQTVDDNETWVAGGVVPTLNAFDNGDSRATVLIFYGNRVDDIRFQGDVINTLQARMGTGGNNMPMLAFHRKQTPISGSISPALGATSEGMGLMNDSVVRRLTPVECERLQGFPDGWTADQADTHRYKQMGNAVAVPVVSWIVDRLVNLHSSL